MNNASYVGLSRQITLRRELDLVANNIANLDTAGFKVEGLMIRTEGRQMQQASKLDGPAQVQFALDDGVARDFGQGQLRETGATFDLGLDGSGFFKIGTDQGERYTRDGRFTLAPDGSLSTQSGRPVLDEGGAPIIIDPTKGPVSIAKDGLVSQDGERVGKVGVVRFDQPGALHKAGDNLYSYTGEGQPQNAPETVVRQGVLESANVNAILEVSRLIEVSRAYESITKIMADEADLSRRSVQRLGSLN